MKNRTFLRMALWLLIVSVLTSCGGGGGSGGGDSGGTSLNNGPAVPFVANGPVYAIAVADDGTTYIGGAFTQIGPATGSFVPIDSSTGKPTASFPKVNGSVYVIVPDNAGGWFIGGTFTYVGGISRNNIAHVLANSTVDPSWSPSANYEVRSLAVSGSTVYAGGFFTSITTNATTTTRNNLAALDAATGEPTSWNPSANGYVSALTVSGSTVYAGGFFTSITTGATTTTRNNLAALDATTGEPTSWNPNADSDVSALTVSGSTVYAGGAFTSITTGATTTTRNYLAALDAATGEPTSWNPSANGYVSALTVSGSTVYAGGFFTSITTGATTTTRNNLAALDATTGEPTSWNPNADSDVSALTVSGSTVYAGGAFTSITTGATTTTRNYLAALDAATGEPTSWNPSANGYVSALTVSGSTVYAGGAFTSITTGATTTTRNYLAALDATTGNPTSWNPKANYWVHSLAVSGNIVYAGGSFINIGGQTRNNLAALNTFGTGTATGWNPKASDSVSAIAVSGNNVYVGGNFTSIGSTARTRFASFDGSGNLTSWNPAANGKVDALVVSGSTVYAGGGFTSITTGATTTTRNRLAALDATTGEPTSWNPSANGYVYALTVSGSTVYAGGGFTSITTGATTTTRNRLAALDATTGEPTSWNPIANSNVNALTVSGSTVYAGGAFTSITTGATTTTRNYLAALDATTGEPTSWNPNADSDVSALTVSGSTVYVGGYFTSITTGATTTTRSSLAALDATTGEPTAWNPNADDMVESLAISGSTVYAGGRFTSITTGGTTTTRNRLVALDATTGIPTSWDPKANYWVHSLAVSGNIVYAGGSFTSIGAEPLSYFARLSK